MKRELYIVGDIHGEYAMMKDILQYWKKEEQQLVLLGDLAERGPQSLECFLEGKRLVEEEGAIYIRGNHEKILFDWLEDPREAFDWYMRNGGGATITSLLGEEAFEVLSPEEMAQSIHKQYPDLLDFLKNRPLYFETETAICVHAAVDLSLDDWHETSIRDFIWQREPFHSTPNHLDKTIIFGHTVTSHLFKDDTRLTIWEKDGKIGIDTGAAYGGALTGLVWDDRAGRVAEIHQIRHQKKEEAKD
ncbi:metallophosphoesterase [Streptococcus sp. DD13]|uniref:metallophosphoesterase n=1 Tax=Streptococcus sp. DD13 TaxID=1777881 RepID=UPI0007920D06|nr:metallophosphoesterase [Streptococcus sp. DD13]KXT79007.1 Serine/threonine protein phosphatase [Streptococcus sp. DD13]